METDFIFGILVLEVLLIRAYFYIKYYTIPKIEHYLYNNWKLKSYKKFVEPNSQIFLMGVLGLGCYLSLVVYFDLYSLNIYPFNDSSFNVVRKMSKIIFGFTQLNMGYFIKLIGIFITQFGIIFLFWVHWTMKDSFSPVLEVRQTISLKKDGPFRYIRHPMYTSWYLLCFGFLFVSQNMFVFSTFFSHINLTCILRLEQEEKMLLEEFGEEYQNYISKTDRLFPLIY